VRIALAGFRAHTRRMLATAFAVVFGVAFVVGTLIIGDTARAGYYETFARVAKNVDVAVEAGKTPLTAAQADLVRSLPDVEAVDARMVQPVALVGRDGKPITNFGRVGIGVSTDGDPRLRAFDVTGRVPAAPGEAVIDIETAAHQRYGIGDTIVVLDPAGTRHAFTLVGLIDFRASQVFSDQSVVGVPVARLRELSGADGYDEIVALARPGVPPAELSAKVRGALGAGPRVSTGDQRRDDLADDATQVAAQFRLGLLIFGVVALIVATFVIYNTFAILLVQRIRETALLRCVGASRRQIFVSVLLESATIGLVGGAAGVAVGVGVAYGLLALLNGVLDSGVPAHSLVVAATPVVAGLAVGLAATVAAALVPAIRATRTSPLAALRDVAMVRVTTRRRRLLRWAIAAVVAAAGVGLTRLGTRSSDPEAGTFVIVAGGVVMFLAVLVLAPLFIGPLIALVGALPGRLFGTPARLATANARRNPGRTAVTSATLMIGVGVMALCCVLIGSVRATANRQLTGHYPVDYVMAGVELTEGEQRPIPAAYVQALRQSPEFHRVAETRVATVQVNGAPIRIGAVDAGSLGTLIVPELTEGKLADLRAGTVIASNGQRLGSTMTVTTDGRTVSLPVVGVASLSFPGTGEVDALVTWDELTRLVGPGDVTTVMAKAAPGVSAVASRAVLDGLAGAYPFVTVNSIADLTSELEREVNALLAVFGALLGTTVLIALLGITNTLSLSVVERTRESATLRALGLTRAQLRATLLVEAMLMGIVGALVGVGYGLAYGRLVVEKAFEDVGPTIAVPWSWLLGLLALAALAATVAAVLPARRAARASIVAAMAET
jgi:putative ABC transport system permease protein